MIDGTEVLRFVWLEDAKSQVKSLILREGERDDHWARSPRSLDRGPLDGFNLMIKGFIQANNRWMEGRSIS